jgi:hypothetical protein
LISLADLSGEYNLLDGIPLTKELHRTARRNEVLKLSSI